MSDNASGSSAAQGFPWWLYVIVVLGAFLMAAGGLIALLHPANLVSPHDQINGAVHTYAGYFAARSLAIASMLLVALGLRARGMLSSLLLLSAFIQLLDAGIDCIEGRWLVVPGVAVLCVLFLVASARLAAHPFWKLHAWKQAE